MKLYRRGRSVISIMLVLGMLFGGMPDVYGQSVQTVEAVQESETLGGTEGQTDSAEKHLEDDGSTESIADEMETSGKKEIPEETETPDQVDAPEETEIPDQAETPEENYGKETTTSEEEMKTPENTEEILEDEESADYNDDPEYSKWAQQTAAISDDVEIIDFRKNASGYIHDGRFSDCIVVDGIDVSKYQGDIDWASVRASGVQFAFIRVGYRGYSTGSLAEDPYFKTNIQNAQAAGIRVGVYIFSQAITDAEAVEEANYVLDRIGSYNITMPVVIDYEYVSGASGSTGRLYNANLSREAATSVCKSFCQTVAARGYTPMVYANKTMLENHLNASALSANAEIWLANYTSQTSYGGDYTYWQYSSKGFVSGINGYVDCDFWYRPKSEVYKRTIEDGVYEIESALGSNLVMEIEGASSADGANAALGTKKKDGSQNFRVKYLGNGKYSITAVGSGKLLDVAEGGYAQGTNLQQYKDCNSDTQRWYIIEAGNGYYYLESCWNGLRVNVYEGTAAAGTNICLWGGSDTASQKFKFTRDGLMQGTDGNWYYYNNNTVDRNYTGVVQNENGWFYVENGAWKKNYTGLASNEHGWWYISNGSVDFGYTGLAQNEAGWWYVNGGKVMFEYTGLAENEAGWWYVNGGKVIFEYTGLAENEAGWWYVNGGKVVFEYTGLAENEAGWWYVNGGKVVFEYTGLAENEVGWWYVNRGAVDFNAVGFAENEAGWWYVNGGKVMFESNGLAGTDMNWWYVRGGRVDFDMTGLVQNEAGWWYVNGGRVMFDYTGLAENEAGWWYVNNGMVDFGYNGMVEYNGAEYRVVNGYVQ